MVIDAELWSKESDRPIARRSLSLYLVLPVFDTSVILTSVVCDFVLLVQVAWLALMVDL